MGQQLGNGKRTSRKRKWEEKCLYGYFKRQANEISYDKTWTGLRKVNFNKETESCLIAAQNSEMKTNYVKSKIDKTQKIANF